MANQRVRMLVAILLLAIVFSILAMITVYVIPPYQSPPRIPSFEYRMPC